MLDLRTKHCSSSTTSAIMFWKNSSNILYFIAAQISNHFLLGPVWVNKHVENFKVKFLGNMNPNKLIGKSREKCKFADTDYPQLFKYFI